MARGEAMNGEPATGSTGQPSRASKLQGEVPLCVDLDGTLVACDTLRVSLYGLLRRKPWVFVHLPFQVFRGRAAFKSRVAGLISIETARLPYREEVVTFLRTERQARRRLILVTAADVRIARAVASHLGLFDEVIASDGVSNIKGDGKVSAIRSYLAGGAFDYMGDSVADLPVFAAARRAILVHPSPRVLRRAESLCRIECTFGVAS
ncbi:MAG: haloacid dehalogenase-like hydrolase [Gemmatimonadetes bacterium]|nr:haloacid dehalogenase-like hydrolase [Gemmatimonadota bacterium]MBA4159241.1 haloacid dehalogenase-like hydrolase [Gemmatimonadota bacterium]